MRVLLALFALGVGAWFFYEFARLNGYIDTPGGSNDAMQSLAQTPLIGPTGSTPDRAGDWGDVVVNRTQLARFTEQYGAGTPVVGMGELELGYGGRQAFFTFQAVGECQRQMQFLSMRVPAMSFLQDGGQSFFNQAPACREEMPLRDIKIRFDATLSARFMQAPIYIPQISTDQFIDPEDDIFDVVVKFGLPPKSFVTQESVGVSGFRDYTVLAYPGVLVLFRGSYDYVRQWYQYAGAAATAQDVMTRLNQPTEDPETNSGVEELRRALAVAMQESGIADGVNLMSELKEQLAPKITMVRLAPTPSEAILEAQRQQY